eukprot:68070_1
MTLTEKEAVIMGCIVGSFILIIFGLLLWYFCADTCTLTTPSQTEPDYSKLHIDTRKTEPDQTDAVDEDAPPTILSRPYICDANCEPPIPSQTEQDCSKLYIDKPKTLSEQTPKACICGANLTLIEAQHCYDDRNAID